MKKLSQKELVNNGWWQVLETQWKDTKWNLWNVITMKPAKSESGDAIFVLPVTKKGELIYIKEFRYNIEDFAYQFPAWAVEGDDTPEQAAAQELREETGYKAEKFVYLGEYVMNGYIHGMLHLYLALGCEEVGQQETHELEEIEVLKGSPEQVRKLVDDNIIRCPWSALSYKIAAEKTDNFTKLDILK